MPCQCGHSKYHTNAAWFLPYNIVRLLSLDENCFCAVATVYIHKPMPARSILFHDAVHAANVCLSLGSHETDILTSSHRHDHILQAIHFVFPYPYLVRSGEATTSEYLTLYRVRANKQASIMLTARTLPRYWPLSTRWILKYLIFMVCFPLVSPSILIGFCLSTLQPYNIVRFHRLLS